MSFIAYLRFASITVAMGTMGVPISRKRAPRRKGLSSILRLAPFSL